MRNSPPALDTPGDRIKWLRGEKQMLQITLAKAIGVSGTALSKI